VIGTVLLLIILDLINGYYINIWWKFRQMSWRMTELTAKIYGYDLDLVSAESINEFMGFIDNCVAVFLTIVLVNNIFFYVFYLRKKLWAQGYVLFYTLTTSLFAITFLIEGPILGFGWFVYNLSTLFIYLYLWAGVKLLKFETTDIQQPPVIPANETKVQ
jgi:hypothetical protein